MDQTKSAGFIAFYSELPPGSNLIADIARDVQTALTRANARHWRYLRLIVTEIRFVDLLPNASVDLKAIEAFSLPACFSAVLALDDSLKVIESFLPAVSVRVAD